MARRRGLLVLAGTATVVAAAVTVALPAESPATHGFCAIMSDAIGLYPGNTVTQMGVPIGRVDRVDADSTRVRVAFTVDNRALPSSVKAVTRSTSILADRSLELIGNYTSGPRLQAGQCITPDNTATAKSVSEITSATATLINGVTSAGDGHAAQRLLAALTGQLAGNGPAAGAALATAGQAAADPDPLVATLGQMLTDTAPLVSAADRNWSDVDSAIANAPEGLNTVATVVFPAITKIFHYLPTAMDMILDIQLRYGKYLWPGLDAVAATLHLAATHVDSFEKLADSLPMLSESVRAVAAAPAGELPVITPRVRVQVGDPARLCAVLDSVPGRCAPVAGQAQLTDVDVLQLVLRGGVGR
ncbi:MlaD family protein [Nocardia pseudobrasiliensis]|uniref:Virulence factor Mce-like protein n=1 Tax=Nocardia pseudobrasiliensis TaxID=45979 RepID=A0A370IFZ1_9NOCA|nr:MlaD family protein [Nocardia pseudobrasiliensis]RDI68374.1 virulence factor Mce-like protein [Nocardia pseudobrasiliensis]